jgi:hypothetical protein
MLRSACLTLFCLLISACAEPPATDLEGAQTSQAQLAGSGESSVPVYLGVTNHLSVDDAHPSGFGHIELSAGAEVSIRVTRAAETGQEAVALKLFRVSDGGTPEHLRTVDGAAGTAATTLASPTRNSYLIAVGGTPLPATLALDITCLSGDTCSPWKQPGEICGGRAARCMEGLFCEYDPGTCGRADEPGVCAIRPRVCPLHLRPVCGCDGNTYGNECEARRNDTTVESLGPCPSPEAT